MRVLVPVTLLVATAIAARAAGPPCYTGEIMPQPKRATYEDRFIPVYDIARRRPLATIIAGAESAERLAAEDLIARICSLAGAEDPRFQPRAHDAPIPDGTVICIGSPETNAALAELASRPGMALIPGPRGEQGYVIRCGEESGRQVCLAAGGGPMGSYFAAMSLLQLLTVQDGRVLLRCAQVHDWPTFEMRGICCYTPEAAAWLAKCKFSTLDMNYGSVGRDAWRDPDGMGRPEGWGVYSGAGHLAVHSSAENPHSGERCVRAEISSWYEGFEDRPHYISAALMVGRTGGYDGPDALEAKPGSYRMELWLRGEVPQIEVGVVTWTAEAATRDDRDFAATEPQALPVTGEWTRHEVTFALPEEAVRFAPRLSIVGQNSDGLEIGQGFCVDDVVLTREGQDENLAENPDLEATGTPYTDKIAAMWGWAAPRGLWPIQFVNPLHVSNWEYDGKHKIQVSDPEQIDDLADTFRISLDRGGRWVMLALDDFASRLGGPAPHYIITNQADQQAFDSLGECHGTLVQQLHRRLKSTHPHCRMLVCPAYYWIPHGAYQEEGEKYLRTLGEMAPEDVLIVWTGPRVRSRTITAEQVRHFTSLIGRKPYLWDNTIYARHANPTYVLDPFDSDYPDRFWQMTGGGLHSNGGATGVYLLGSMIYADYAWNPEAYEPQDALDRAIRTVLGQGCVQPARQFHEHYFAVRDPYYELSRDISDMTTGEIAETVGPINAAQVAEIVAHVEAMDAALEELKRCSETTEVLKALQGLAEPLHNSAERLRELGEIAAMVERIDGGVRIPESAFVGGTGHQVYDNACEPRRATWAYGRGTAVHTMTTTFQLDDPPARAALVLVGQDHDKEGVTDVEVTLNDQVLHSGPNEFDKLGWYEWKIPLPSGILNAGANTLIIRNLEQSDSTNSDWVMLAEARLLFD
ncbi:MAG: beta-N-acetylglucosaminidase domain-containing protein [Armatimonadota bacterium]|nr:beta-N-acetylglucosaminidase domain-containing protein [Armatimonadota bacterium]